MNAPATSAAVKTTCPYCGVGCGVLARPDGFGGTAVQGDGAHPANLGRLCSKGSALGETMSLDDRLLYPMVRSDGGTHSRVTWDAALEKMATGFKATVDRYGPDAVAFYVSGQLLTEDYYVANKLMKGFIGSGNIDTNSRLCMASSVAGHKRAFGSDTVPGCYEDLDTADLLVLTGSNAAWCHPVLFQRMLANKRERGARIVVIDPRRTATADEADLFLPIAPGTDQILFAGLLCSLDDVGLVDHSFVERNTNGFSDALETARKLAPSLEAVASRCEVDLETLKTFFSWFCKTEKSVTLYSQGVNQSTQGTDKVNAITNCHLASGRIGKPGMGPFSLTGQPNAMGGREVGGLANQLAAHMGFDEEDVNRVGRFWNTGSVASRPGLKAVDLFEAVAQRRVRALWIMCTNPAVSMPRADAVRAALRELDMLVVSDAVVGADTLVEAAHVVLPAATWGEKDGTVTNSERRISRQRGFLALPGEVKPDWWAISELGRRMGFADAFDYTKPADIFREHAELSAFENDGSRDFDLSGLTGLTDADYDALEPIQWPVRSLADGGTKRLFSDGGFFTRDQRANMIAVEDALSLRSQQPGFPLLLNTGRVRDHWHTMTRTGKAPRLGAHVEEPFVSVHPADAVQAGIPEGGFVRVSTPFGRAILRASVTDRQRCGEIFAPIHWTADTSSDGRVGALAKSDFDPISGQPEMKATPAAIEPVDFSAHGFLLRRSQIDMPSGMLWSRTSVVDGFGYRFAMTALSSSWREYARQLLTPAADTGLVELFDEAQGWYRAALVNDGRLDACVFIAQHADALPRWEWLKEQLGTAELSAGARRALLAGRPAEAGADQGPIVCACYGVGKLKICRAIQDDGLDTVEAIGQALKAGTNCGSCVPELRTLIADSSAQKETADSAA